MDDRAIDWKRDSRSFDTVAELYDAYRPSYPAALVDDILSTSAIPGDGHVLEIGSGTGIATILFAQRGYSILCIEPGEHLVKIARRKLRAFPKVDFRVTAFEDWRSVGEAFDLVISAQAFHWVPEEIRYQKTARILKTGGYLALFWNHYPALEAPITQSLERVYQVHAPELVPAHPAACEEGIQRWVREIAGSGYFDLVDVRRYPWQRCYTTERYLGLLNTYSDHLRLPEERRRRLLEGIAEVIEQAGGRIEKLYEAVAYIDRKRSPASHSTAGA